MYSDKIIPRGNNYCKSSPVNKQSYSVHICIYTPLSVGTLLGDLSFRFSSTVSSKIKYADSEKVVTDYSPKLVTAHPQWQPSTLQQRMEWIDKETPHIRFSNKWIYRATASFLLTKKTTRYN